MSGLPALAAGGIYALFLAAKSRDSGGVIFPPPRLDAPGGPGPA